MSPLQMNLQRYLCSYLSIINAYFNFKSVILDQVTTGYGRDQTAVGLTPFTPYQFQVEACTLEHLCVRSESAYSATMPAAPKGQDPPVVVSVGATNVTLRWSAPAEANGIINRFACLFYSLREKFDHQSGIFCELLKYAHAMYVSTPLQLLLLFWY